MVIGKLHLQAALLAVLLSPALLFAQSGITVDVHSRDIGLDGVTRYGDWTGVCLTINNQTADAREVRCQWVLRDGDGDIVLSQRITTLTPGRVQKRWLYAATPVAASMATDWRFRIIDQANDELLASTVVRPNTPLSTRTAAIGIIGVAEMGLERYKEQWTQHETINMIGGLEAARLPDRWYGLASIDTLIWTPRGAEPTDSSINPESFRAIRQWIERGGHLVIVVPSIANPWDQSPLAGILPDVEAFRETNQPHPKWLGGMTRSAQRFDVHWFRRRESAAGDHVSVLLTDDRDRPMVVASACGFGRVTLVGFDLTDRRLLGMGLPHGNQLWKTIFNWQSPAYSGRYIQGEVKQGRISNPDFRGDPNDLGIFIGQMVVMRETASGALLLAILMFGTYWVLAGPFSYLVLKKKNREHHSWLVFTAVVAVFSLIAWSGAVVMRPRLEGIRHFSVLDLDAATGQGHVRSWMSLFAPVHRVIDVDIASHTDKRDHNLLAGIGVDPGSTATGFVDPQSYLVDAARPDRLGLPMRSTAKYLTADYMADWMAPDNEFAQQWVMPQGDLQVVDGWPTGQLSHGLPGVVEDLLVVYCPGNGQPARVYQHDERAWQPGDLLTLGRPTADKWDNIVRDFIHASDLPVTDPKQLESKDRHRRLWKREGRLGRLIGQGAGTRAPAGSLNSDLKQRVEMLSFFETLPPPEFLKGEQEMGFTLRQSKTYYRRMGRSLDMTGQLGMGRVILIGFINNSAIPVPVRIDGDPVSSKGVTVVRWIYPLPVR